MAIRTASFGEIRSGRQERAPCGVRLTDSPRAQPLVRCAWRSVDRALPASDVSCRASGTARPGSHHLARRAGRSSGEQLTRRLATSRLTWDTRGAPPASGLAMRALSPRDACAVPASNREVRVSTSHNRSKSCSVPACVFRFRLGIEAPVKDPDPVRKLARAFLAPCGARCTSRHMLGRHLQPTFACAFSKRAPASRLSIRSRGTDERLRVHARPSASVDPARFE